MNKCSKIQASIKIALATSFALFGTAVMAHDGGINDAGTPVCLEANYMVADAMNAPFFSVPGPGPPLILLFIVKVLIMLLTLCELATSYGAQ